MTGALGRAGEIASLTPVTVSDQLKTYFFERLADRVRTVEPRLRRGTQENGLIQRFC
jgi:hypothetical protein